MKRLGAVLVAMSMLAVGTEALGQPMGGRRGGAGGGGAGGGWGPEGRYGRLYDPKTVETVKGEIEKVERITPFKGMSAGVHLQLKTDKETLSVHLGPQWYLDNQELKLEPKDKVEVKGSRVTIDGKPALIAAEVVRGDQVLKLRDENGVPMWAGWRRRAPQPAQ